MHAGLGLSETHLLLHSNTAAQLYDLTLDPPRLAFAFTCLQAPPPVLQGQLLFRAEGASIELCSMSGTVEQTLVTSEVKPLSLLSLPSQLTATATVPSLHCERRLKDAFFPDMAFDEHLQQISES